MRDALQSYMKVGIVHFMAYPECLKGEGPIYDTLTKIVEDDFFSAVEITWIKDPAERQRVKSLLAASGMTGGDGATAVAVLSGPDPGQRREEAMKLLIDSLRELAAYCQGKGLRLVLESFDAKYDKKCLIGPHKDALTVCKALRRDFPDFGIMVDLSHLPIQEESPKKAFSTLKKANIAHIHIGNCVKQQGHPLYGDQHPRFGIPGGENDVPQVVEFLKALFEIQYLAKGRRPVVAFEGKPAAGETSGAIIANAKRTLTEAWAKV